MAAAVPGALTGTPSLSRYSLPSGHTGSNYTLAYSNDGRFHIGGTSGLYTYDGRQWHVFVMPNNQLIRELKYDGESRLYTGGYDQFGYIEWDARNLPQFTDFTELFADELGQESFADIWQIVIRGDWVYFRGVRHLFAVNTQDLSHQLWRHEGRFGDLFDNGEILIAQYRGEGLRYLNDTLFDPIPDTDELTDQVLAFLPFSVSGSTAGGHLILSRTGQWRTITGNTISPLVVPATMPASSEFSAWLTLSDNTYALGDSRGNLHVLDINRQTHQQFRIANDYISELVLLADSGILAQTDTETIHVPWPSPWLKTGTERGLSGSIHKLVAYGDSWLTIGNAGVMRSFSAESAFVPSDWTTAEAWDWYELSPDKGLLAESYVLKEIQGSNSRTVSRNDFYPRLIYRSRFDTSIFYIGTELGIAVMQQRDNEWTTLFVQENLIGLVRDILETAPGELLLSVADHGLIRARFPDDYSQLMLWENLDNSSGIPGGVSNNSRLSKIGNDAIVASTSAGFYEYVNGSFTPASITGLQQRADAGEIFVFRQVTADSLWAYSERHVFEWRTDQGWYQHDLQSMSPGRINSLGQLADGSIYVGGIASILRFDAESSNTTDSDVHGVRIRSVVLRSPHGDDTAMTVSATEIKVPDRSHTLVIEYSPDRMPLPLNAQYQTALSGPQNIVNDWDDSTRISYSDLRPGIYQFSVTARNNQGQLSTPALLNFEVQPYWYQTAWALALWLGAGIAFTFLLLLSFTRWRLARLRIERNRLRMMVDERTAELATANRKLENIANIDALTGIANRRQLDHYLHDAGERCAASNKPLGIILIDVDHFKLFNDQYGHQRGDELLRALAEILAQCLRRSDDMLARYGGEEFIAVLPGAEKSSAFDVAENMRKAVSDSGLGISISAGVTSKVATTHSELQELIGEADKRLYVAKSKGRNRTIADN